MATTSDQTQQFKRFRIVLAVGALLIFASFLMYQLGRDNATLVAVSGWVGTLGLVVFVLAVLARWRGPWQDR